MIKIGSTLLEASLTRSGDTLSISMVGGMTLDALAALLDPGSAPEIRVLDEDGETAAIYQNHAVTALTVETVGEARQADVIREHDEALCEVAGMAADTLTLSDEAGAALVELAGMVADLTERVGAIEALQAAPNTASGEVN